jgi:hypothetical protein
LGSKKHIIIIILIFISFINPSNAQIYQQWVTKFRDDATNHCFSICTDYQDNIILAGEHLSSGIGIYFTVKFNKNGILQWKRLYSGPNTDSTGTKDEAIKCICDINNNIYVTGSSKSYNMNNEEDIVTIKYSPEGDTLWTKRFDNVHKADNPYRMLIDKYSNIYILGESWDSLYSKYGILILKYDSNGNELFHKVYSSSHQCYSTDMALDSLGNICVLGETMDAAIIIKYSNNGYLQWFTIYEENYWEYQPLAIVTDCLNNIYITGTVGSTYTVVNGSATVKYDMNKNVIWVNHFNLHGDDYPGYLTIDSKSNIYLDSKNETLKYDSSGKILWIDTINFIGNTFLDKNDNIYKTRIKIYFPTQHSSIVTSKLNTENAGIIWQKEYFADTNYSIYPTEFYGLSDNSNNIIVDYFSWYYPIQNSDSITLIKYSEISYINNGQETLPSNYNLFQNYPNPFNPTTKIKFQIGNSKSQINKLQNIKLIIYDILGREIITLVNKNLSPGIYEVNWESNGYSSGIYFYSLIVNEKRIETKKMIIFK